MPLEFYVVTAEPQGFMVAHEERDKGMRSGQNVGLFYPDHKSATDAIKQHLFDNLNNKTFIICHYPCDVALSKLAFHPFWTEQSPEEIKWEEQLIGVFDDEEQAVEYLFSIQQKVMSIGMEQRLHDKLKDYAKHQQVSISHLIQMMVEKAVGGFPEPRKYLSPETPLLAEFTSSVYPHKTLPFYDSTRMRTKKTCTCDGLTLLHYGCKCGNGKTS